MNKPIFEQLKRKELKFPHLSKDWAKITERVLFLDPTRVYEGLRVDVYARNQNSTTLTIGEMFPNTAANLCACGCGAKLGGRRKRWASEACSDFAYQVHSIIAGRLDSIAHALRYYHFDGGRPACMECGDTCDLEIDHVVAVANGGGACWLNNYRYLCKPCHRDKTNKDFAWKQPKPAPLFEWASIP